MDNDLMARRLRPPSEPTQPAPSHAQFTPPEYDDWDPDRDAWPATTQSGPDLAPPHSPELPPPWGPVAPEAPLTPSAASASYEATERTAAPTDDVNPALFEPGDFEPPAAFEPATFEPAPFDAAAFEPAAFEPPAAAVPAFEPRDAAESAIEPGAFVTPAAPEPTPWSSQARDEVPWDRPGDYEQPTDTATPDQPSWDRPAPEFWADPHADEPVAEAFMPDAGPDRSGLPPWTQPAATQAAAAVSPVRVDDASAPQVVASDPDDAYAPVLGDIPMPAARAWPEMNGHDAGRNDATVAAAAIATAPAAIPAKPVPGRVDADADWGEPVASMPRWPGHEKPDNGWVPEPLPSEWVMPDRDPAQGSAADQEPPAAPLEPVPSPPGVAPDPLAAAPTQPLVVRIELAIVDDSRHLVTPDGAAWRVNDVNAVVVEVGASELALEAERLTPRHPAFEPRGINGEDQADSTWIEPGDPSVDLSIPPATAATPPWLQPTAASIPESQPAPWDVSPQAESDWPSSIGSGQVPAASTAPPPWAQSPAGRPARPDLDAFAPSSPKADPLSAVDLSPWDEHRRSFDSVVSIPAAQMPARSVPAAPQFAPPQSYELTDSPAAGQALAQSAFAPPVYVDRESNEPVALQSSASTQAQAVVAHEQSDLWFLSTEPADIDAANEDELVIATESSWKMVLVTIAFAILVIALFGVFIQFMTALG